MGKTYVVFFNLKLYVNNVFSFFLSFLHIVRFEHFLDSICWYNKQLAYCVRLKLHTCVFVVGKIFSRLYSKLQRKQWNPLKIKGKGNIFKTPCMLFISFSGGDSPWVLEKYDGSSWTKDDQEWLFSVAILDKIVY